MVLQHSSSVSLYLVIVLVGVLGSTLARPQEQSPPVAILQQNHDTAPDGSYKFNFETENGIRVQEETEIRPSPQASLRQGADPNDDDNAGVILIARGSFSYTAPDGTPITVTYVADHNGFQPVGDHLPTPPPIPAAIQRLLDSLPRDEPQETQARQQRIQAVTQN